jgi:hypothetical protein
MPPRPEDWSRVRELFVRALALPATERAPYVAAVCGDDSTIRDKILRMLDSHSVDPRGSPPITVLTNWQAILGR